MFTETQFQYICHDIDLLGTSAVVANSQSIPPDEKAEKTKFIACRRHNLYRVMCSAIFRHKMKGLCYVHLAKSKLVSEISSYFECELGKHMYFLPSMYLTQKLWASISLYKYKLIYTSNLKQGLKLDDI